MATLNIPQNSKAVKGRTARALPSVDLTAMVDLAFLLITFFMLTTSLAKMKSLNIVKPVPITDIVNRQNYPASRTMTILLGKNDQAVYYMGETENASMQETSLKLINQQIAANKLTVAKNPNNQKGKELIVIIKPTSTSTYKNFVDIIDEIHIADIKSYAIDDKYITEKEKAYLSSKGI
jgi:biopolymer transport protein ExbD